MHHLYLSHLTNEHKYHALVTHLECLIGPANIYDDIQYISILSSIYVTVVSVKDDPVVHFYRHYATTDLNIVNRSNF